MYNPRAFNLGSSGFGQKAEELAPLRFIQIADVYWAPTEGAPGAENARAPGPQGGSLGAGGGQGQTGAQEVRKREEFFQNVA